MTKTSHPPPGKVTETRFSLLEQEVYAIKSDLTEFRAEVRGYFQSSKSTWRSAWPVVVTVGAVLWFVLNLQITSSTRVVDDKANRVTTLAEQNGMALAKLTDVVGPLPQQNATSIQDRKDQHEVLVKAIDVQTSILATLAREQAERLANEREVETQIDAGAQMLNVQFAEQQRKNADFQNTFHDLGAKWPVAAPGPWVVPNVSNRNHGRTTNGN